jgi:single-strand DNA-binding protein
MAHIVGKFVIGRDAELRVTPSGDQVINLPLASNYGKRDGEGNRPSQWVEASLWGQRAEKLAPYLLKGGQVYAVLGEPHIETYDGKNGPGSKLVARVIDIELMGSKRSGDDQGSGVQQQPKQAQQRPQETSQRQQQAPQQRQQQSAAVSSNFDDDDIPF